MNTELVWGSWWLCGLLTTLASCGPPRVPAADRTDGTVDCVAKPPSQPASCPDKDAAELTPPSGYQLVSVDNGPVEQDGKCCYGITIDVK